MSFRDEYERAAAEGFAHAPAEVSMVTEADLAHLPAPVRRYLEVCGVIGKPRVWNYRVRLTGLLRNGPTSPWMRVKIDQQSFVDPAARLFLIRASMKGVPFRAFHRYVGSHASFRVRVAGLFTVVDAKGPEMDTSETVTLFNDMCLLAPATLIDRRIVWEDLGERRVKGTFTNAGNTITAVLVFDERGVLVDFYSDDRLQTTDGTTYTSARWSTPVHEWHFTDEGARAGWAEAVWGVGEERYAYARFDAPAIEYNVAP